MLRIGTLPLLLASLGTCVLISYRLPVSYCLPVSYRLPVIYCLPGTACHFFTAGN